MLDLLETVLIRYVIQNLRYNGKVWMETREAALVAFRKMGGPGVTLISMKCVGIGLNFTTANRLIKYVATSTSSKPSNHSHSIDLAWAFVAESQAYDRMHRLG